MRILKRLLKILGLTLEIITAFLVCYGAIMLLGMGICVGELSKSEGITIYVQTNGIHTDVVFPANSEYQNWYQFIDPKVYKNQKHQSWITIGWGDKGFLLDTPTWGELKFSTAFNAAILPSSTAMHVAYSGEPKENDRRVKITISTKQYERMIAFVKYTFKLKDDLPILIPDKGYGDKDNFYEAKGNYHMFKTCNTWTNDVLKVGGVRTSIYALYSDGIIEPLKARI